jgi:hypothetical protein
MKFAERNDDRSVDVIFEIDEKTDFSEQYVAMSALGTLVLEKKDDISQNSISYLGVKIRNADPTEEKKKDSITTTNVQVMTDLNRQEADELVEALQNFRRLKDEDLYNFSKMRNYQAISTRVIENVIASQMIDSLCSYYEFDLLEPKAKPVLGFGAVLQDEACSS